MGGEVDRFRVVRHGRDHQAPVGRYGPLDPARVPEPLRHLIPFAEQWGIGDDVLRDRTAEAMPPDTKAFLEAELKRLQHELYVDWLGGPEAKGPRYSAEYLAFSALGMLF